MPTEPPVSYRELAKDIAQFGGDEVFCTRLIRRFVQRLRQTSDVKDVAAAYQKPESTGHPEWDALIAGLAVHTWATSGHPGVPDWATAAKPLSDWWEPGHMPARWRFWNLVNTPPSIREQMVIFPRQWLEAV